MKKGNRFQLRYVFIKVMFAKKGGGVFFVLCLFAMIMVVPTSTDKMLPNTPLTGTILVPGNQPKILSKCTW
jgi:hypothetical protein